MKLLVAVDLSEATQIIVDKVIELCRKQPTKLWIVHNAEPQPDVVEFKVDPLAARESLAKKFHKEHRQVQEIADRCLVVTSFSLVGSRAGAVAH